MSDLVSEIIASNVNPDLEGVEKRLREIIAAMKEVDAAGKGLLTDMKGVKTFVDLNSVAEKNIAIVEKMSVVEAGYSKVVKDSISLKEKHNGATKDLVEVIDKLAGAELKGAQATTENAKARRENAKASIDEARANKLVIAEKEREIKAIKKLTNEYEQLKAQYNAASLEAKRLGVVAENTAMSMGRASNEYKIAAANAQAASHFSMGLYDSLLRVEKSVGQAQRQVGQYNQAAFAMQQILRETPAFAYSFATGISAIANNIPILVDEIKRMNVANAELVAQGGKAIPVWKTLWASILSPMGLLTLAIGAVTIFTARMAMAANNMKTVTDVGKKYADTLKSINDNSAASSADEAARAKSLLGVAQNISLSMKIRLKAVKDLQDEYPDYLGNISKEKVLTGDLAKEMEALNRALMAKGLYEASTKKIGAAYTKIFEAEQEMKKLDLEFARQLKEMRLAGANPNDGEATFKHFEEKKNAFRKQVADAKKEIVDFQKFADQYASEAGGTLFGKKPKGKAEKTDKTLTGDSGMLKAIHDNKIKELEISRDTNKAISDDVKQELGDRLVAYQQYTADVLELAKMERNLTIDLEAAKIEDIDRKKEAMKKANPKAVQTKEYQDLLDQQGAAYIRWGTANKEFNNFVANQTRIAQKENLNIVASANGEWIKDEESKNRALVQQDAAMLVMSEQQLQHMLDSKEITRREYNKRMADLVKSAKIIELQTEIDFDRQILENDQISAEERARYQEKLNSNIKALAVAKSGKVETRKGNAHITDGLANILAPEDTFKGDLDKRQQYLDDFYKHAADLANQAEDAIITAQNRRYDNEKKALDDKSTRIESDYKDQVDIINATTRNDVDRQNKLLKLNAEKQAQEADITVQKRKIEIEQARFARKAAIAGIIQSTAVAIAAALKYGPAAPPIIALIAATGAVQLGVAASAPIPAYKHGIGLGKGEHPGGLFIAGDGGQHEYIKEPGKPGYFSSNVATIYSGAPGTQVIPPQYFSSNSNTPRLEEAKRMYEQNVLSQQIGQQFSKEIKKSTTEIVNGLFATKVNIPKGESMREAVIQIQRLGK